MAKDQTHYISEKVTRINASNSPKANTNPAGHTYPEQDTRPRYGAMPASGIPDGPVMAEEPETLPDHHHRFRMSVEYPYT